MSIQSILNALVFMALRSPLLAGAAGFLGGLYYYDAKPDAAKALLGTIMNTVTGWL